MKIYAVVALCAISSIHLAGCSKEPQPSKSEIEQALTTQLPAFVRVSSLSVDAIQNLGTKVEPMWQSRFTADIKLSADTFSAGGEDPGITFVRSVHRSGDSIQLFGRSESRLFAGQWRTKIEFDGNPIGGFGVPVSGFAGRKVIVRGSKEESEYHAEITERAKQARLAVERAAEEQRMKEQRAIEEKRKALAQANKLLIGVWRDENSLIEYQPDGTVVSKHDNGSVERSRWSIDGDILVTTPTVKGLRVVKYRIVDISSSTLTTKVLSVGEEIHNGDETFHATRVK